MTDADHDPAAALEWRVIQLLTTHGPLPIDKLVALVEPPLLAYLREEGVPEAELAEAVIEDVVVTDDIWCTPDDTLALTAPLLDGTVFTHRLTGDEFDRGEVLITPDLVLLGWNDFGGIDMDDGRLVRVDGIHVPGESFATYEGPDGWLDGFAPGDLLTFRMRHGVVSVHAVADSELGDDTHIVDTLRRAAEARIHPGQGEEADPILLDALVADAAAFRSPARPVGELMEAAGFERRGFLFGRAGQDWSRKFETLAAGRQAQAIAKWRLDACCVDALELVSDAFATIATEEPDAAAVAEALLHGDVADAFIDSVIGPGADPSLVTLVAFADAVAHAVPARQRGGALVVAALAHDRLGDGLAAEAALRQARAADPDFGPAASHLVDYELDRGALGAAITLLHHPDVAPQPEEAALLEEFRQEQSTAFRNVGRNDPCPCGSGRKFKQCCQNKPAPLATRTRLVNYRLARYAGLTAETQIVGVASAAVDDDDPDPLTALRRFAEMPFIVDLAVFDDGVAEDYLAARGPLLPDDERDLVAAAIAAPRRLCEITAVERGVSLTMRDTKSGETFVVSERLGSMEAEVGEFLFVRIVAVGDSFQSFGAVIDVPLRLRASALALCDADPSPSADEFAAWYGAAHRPPTITNTEGEPILVCEVRFATAASVGELHALLDGRLERGDEGEWTDVVVKGNGERLVRGMVRYDNGELVVVANSSVRAERLVALVRAAVPGLALVSDERLSLEEARDHFGDKDAAPTEPPPEAAAFLDKFMRKKELEWLDESVPALAGLTPRDAAADPTRREDLLALLREIDARPAPAAGAASFDAGRLRRLLGLI